MIRFVIDTSALIPRSSKSVFRQVADQGAIVEVPALVLAERVRQLVRDKPGVRPGEVWRALILHIELFGKIVPFTANQARSLGVNWRHRIERMIRAESRKRTPDEIVAVSDELWHRDRLDILIATHVEGDRDARLVTFNRKDFKYFPENQVISLDDVAGFGASQDSAPRRSP